MSELADLIWRIRRDAAYLRGSIHASDQDVAADLDEAVEVLTLAKDRETSAKNEADDERSKRSPRAD
jgi:hypothetical protein